MSRRRASTSARSDPPAPDRAPPAWANAIAIVAAGVMVVAGLWAVLVGFSALLGEALFADPGGYLDTFDLGRWGWLLLLLGVLVVGAAFGVMLGGRWARATGLALAVPTLVAAILLVPHQPVWAVLVIVLSLLVVVALTAHRPTG